MTPEQLASIQALQKNIERVFYGKPEAVKALLVAVFSSGHVLIEDVPGIGKTLLAKALARSLDCVFQRIQFTSDLLPSDVTGVSVYDPGVKQFVFKPGPIFANVLLADEINRTSPRTQSALLEGMNDFQISADGVTHPLPKPFIVLATQNPFEFEGTYPLPESELDRFFIRLSIGYPPREDEMRILKDNVTMESVDRLTPVMTVREVLDLQAAAGQVRMDRSIAEYLLQIVERTRQAPGRGHRHQPARQPGALPRRPGARDDRGPRLRAARRRETHVQAGLPASARLPRQLRPQPERTRRADTRRDPRLRPRAGLVITGGHGRWAMNDARRMTAETRPSSLVRRLSSAVLPAI